MSESPLQRFLAVKRWRELFDALREASNHTKKPGISTVAVFTCVIIAATPVALTILQHLSPSRETDLPTIGFAVCTILAILMRRWLSLEYTGTSDWKKALNLTHTAFALGCFPVAIVIALNPSMFADRHDIITTAIPLDSAPKAHPLWFAIEVACTVVFLAAWAAITEEVLFRGLLVASIRRWSVINSQKKRDALALGVSAALFGFAHYPTWGATAALALAFLGTGFVLGYIANGERLTPLILYHFIFDTLSIIVIFLM